MGKAAVGFRDGELSVVWVASGNPSTSGMSNAMVVNASNHEEALTAYDAATGASVGATHLKIAEVQAWWQSVCDAGFDTELGWTLAMQDADRDKLDQARNQLLLKSQTETMSTYYPPPLFDQAGIPRVQNGVDQLAVLNAYAEHVGDCVSLFGGYIGLIGQGNLLFTVGDPLPEVV